MTDNADAIQKIATRARELFTLPSVAVRVIELTENPKVDVRALKECIENDPALTAKILRVVNSSLFGLSREVSDLNQALALLGTKPLKLLVLGFSLPDALFRGVGATFLAEYWRRTLTRAVVARELAEQYWRVPGDDAFIAALLEDIGLLVLAQELGETWITFYDRVRREHAHLTTMETKALGFNHTELTVRLVEHWKLPASLSSAIAAASAPDRMFALHGSTLELAQVMRLSNLVAEILADGHSESLHDLHHCGLEYRGLTERDFDELLRDLEAKVAQLAAALSLELPTGFPYEKLWKKAHERLLVASAEVAEDIVRMRVGANDEEMKLLAECKSLSAAVDRLSAAPTRRVDRAIPVSVTATATEVPRAPSTPAPSLRTFHERTGVDSNDPGVLGRLTAAIAAARQVRCAVSVLCVEVDRQDELLLHLGPSGMRQWVDRVFRACDAIDHDPPAQCIDLADGRWMLLLIDCDRRQAVDYGQQLLRAIRLSTQPKTDARLSISVGAASVAMPSANFPPKDLLTAAERCLQAALTSGGDVLKSIEIY
jgi:HD-like signal output (HDOD) protein